MQRGASMVLGKIPMEFSKTLHEEYGPARRACTEALIFEKEFYWSHANGYDQWFIDALSVDASKVLSGRTILWDCKSGLQPPVHESDVVNASPGSTPVVQVFLLSHAQHGTLAIYPHLSNHGGKKDAWDDFDFWTKWLTQEEHDFIKEQDYYIQPQARDKASPEALQRMQGDEFDPKLFLVRLCASCISQHMCPHMQLHLLIHPGPPRTRRERPVVLLWHELRRPDGENLAYASRYRCVGLRCHLLFPRCRLVLVTALRVLVILVL